MLLKPRLPESHALKHRFLKVSGLPETDLADIAFPEAGLSVATSPTAYEMSVFPIHDLSKRAFFLKCIEQSVKHGAIVTN